MEEDDVEIVCPDCDEEMWYLDEETTTRELDNALDEESEMWVSWKPSDCKECTFYVCGDCKIIKVVHNVCGDQLLLRGHMGFHYDGSEHMRNSKTGTKMVLDNPKPIKDKNEIRFDVSDLKQTKFRVNDWNPNGPGDEYHHFWHCESCAKDFKFGRK